MKIDKDVQSAKEKKIKFTAKQRRIVKAWAMYPTIAEASKEMEISENTFQTHLRRLRQKVKVNRTFDVYQYMKNHDLL